MCQSLICFILIYSNRDERFLKNKKLIKKFLITTTTTTTTTIKKFLIFDNLN